MPTNYQRLFIYLNLWLLLLLLGNRPAQVSHLSSSLENSLSNAAQPAPSNLMFIENVGQFDAQARFVMRSGLETLYVTENALWFTVLEPSEPQTRDQRLNALKAGNVAPQATPSTPRRGVNLKLSFPGANPNPRLEPFNRLNTHVSFLKGNNPAQWRVAVPVWGGLRFVDLYPGVDLELTGQQGQFVQRLVVRDPSPASSARSRLEDKNIRLRVDGADTLGLAGNDLRLSTAVGELTLPLLQPVAADGSPLDLPATPPTVNNHEIAAPFAPAATAFLRPVPVPGRTFGLASPLPQGSSDLLYSTLLGGGGECWSGGFGFGCDLTVDEAGNTYVTGPTTDSGFPVTAGAFDTSYNGGGDVFVAKVNATGSDLLYATFLGGSGSDTGYAIAVDNAGNAYIGGGTHSSDFPATAGAFDTSLGGFADAFVAKLNATGTGLTYATFLGGTDQFDDVLDIAVDGAGNAYVVGDTSFDFPTTPGAFDTSANGQRDAFVTKLNAGGSALLYSTYLGGTSWDVGNGIAVDSAGNAYVMGDVSSDDFPVVNPLQATRSGGSDVFVTKLNASGSVLLYSTFLGGSGDDDGNGIALDSTGNVYLAGNTFSPNFPTANPLQAGYGGTGIGLFGGDAFAAKLNATGSGLVYSTYLGGSGDDAATAIALDSSGNAYITGLTQSANSPTTAGALDTVFGGGTCVTGPNTYPCSDAFVVKLTPGGISNYATFLGGSDRDEGLGLAVDGAGNAYVAGFTFDNFPTTAGAFDTTSNGIDAFVSKLKPGDFFAIAGRITDNVGNPLSNVLISTAAGYNTSTNANGDYTMAGLPAGTYTLVPTLSNHTFSPTEQTVTVPPGVTGLNFTGVLQSSDCPLVELISVRHLNDDTLGVVGFVDLNAGQGVTSATLTAQVSGVTVAARDDLLSLAQNNAPGGYDISNGPATALNEQRLPGLWSATLVNSEGGFESEITLTAEAVGANQSCSEQLTTTLPTLQIHIRGIAAAGDNPDGDGLAVRAETSNGSLPHVTFSHYQFDPANPGLTGTWNTAASVVLQADGNFFVPGEFVNAGENLYRVTVDGQPGVEDIDGFYAVPRTTLLTTGESKQRRQAIVFRDAVRAAIAGNHRYATLYPEQLIVAKGAQEGGGTVPGRPGFSNEGKGIMQVTCFSGYRGTTQLGELTKCPLEIYQANNPNITEDPYPDRPLAPDSYEDTAESIDFNVEDALLVLDFFYSPFRDPTKPYPRDWQVIRDNNQKIDPLITAVVHYNKGHRFLDEYRDDPTESIYLGAIARQLEHNPEGGNSLPPPLSIAEFLADADYASETSDLINRLQCGQVQVDSFLNNVPFTGCP